MLLTAPQVQYCFSGEDLPDAARFAEWAQCLAEVASISELDAARGLVVRLVDREEMTSLNSQWRGKDYATNVLAFPLEEDSVAAHIPLGDIVICPPVVQKEALDQKKPFVDRMAHMFVHGMLHLLGYDHESSDEAQTMEALEREALARLGYANPYE